MRLVRNLFVLESKINISKGKNPKGVTLILVLMFILFVVIVANVALIVLRSHTRLTHHQINRIQGFYAAQVGMNYALEMLRIGPGAGGWSAPIPGTPDTYTICAATHVPPCNVVEDDFPHTIDMVAVIVADDDPPAGDGIIEISATATYD